MVAEVPDGLSIVRTVHTHAPYCPSQGRFLKSPGAPCDRNYGLLGCLWGHAVNRCGSVRPAALRRNFATVRTEMRTLRQIPTIVVSDFLRQQMIRAGYPADRIDVLYLPCPAAKPYAPPPAVGKPRFAFLGRMIPHKGVDWLLRAVQRVRADVAIDLAGTGNQEAEYRALASTLNLDARVSFHGWLAGEQVDGLLAGARALIFPSIWHEPGGTVAFEAMVAGRAVVMSRVGGMPEVVDDGQNGLLIEPGDVDALAAAIDHLARDYDLARRLGETGRRRVLENYTLEQHMARLHALYARGF
jgi:glycosyltransferase involved in cell wall biosynthesis